MPELTPIQKEIDAYLSNVFGVEAMPHQIIELQRICNKEQEKK